MANTLFDMAINGHFTPEGSMAYLTNSEALGNAIKVWLCTPRGDLVRNSQKGSFVYEYMNVPMTKENANALKSDITNALLNDFQPPLQVITLDVQPDPVKRKWMISGSFYSRTYNLSASLDIKLATV